VIYIFSAPVSGNSIRFTLAIDGIIVALFAQQQHLEKKRTWTRKLVLITDGENPLELDDDDLSGTINKIIEYNVDMTIMYVRSRFPASSDSGEFLRGVDFDDEDFPYEEPNKSKIKVKSCFPWHS
jgi:ATP-dependent DNA helicase 2 subunit 2